MASGSSWWTVSTLKGILNEVYGGNTRFLLVDSSLNSYGYEMESKLHQQLDRKLLYIK